MYFLSPKPKQNRYTCRKPINCQTIFWSGFFPSYSSGKYGLGTDTCRSFAGLRDASQDNQASTNFCYLWKGPTKGFSIESKLFLILKKKQHLICILGCCRRSRGSITSVFLPERRNSPYLQDFARTRDHPFGAGRSSRWDNSISGYYTGLRVDYSVASKPTTTS